MTEEQAVIDEADAQKNSGAEAVDAQETKATPSLDELLDNFDQKAAKPVKPETPQKAAEADALAKALDRIDKLERRLEGDDFDREFASTASRLSDGLKVDEEAFKNELYGKVARDPRLVKIFEKREENPAAWKEVESALRSDFEKRYPKQADDIDEDLTRERESMAANIRGMASTAPRRGEPSNDDIAKMSDEEFDKYQLDRGVNPYG